ncbi:DUF1428 domain-containing protein [Marinobacter sp. KMM 10035]|uniref:DUF1428 domain-containing protein n=1 Tax=Marinobacter sp. KMM 10035 TaxID=3134034 RepID=UPI00397945B9
MEYVDGCVVAVPTKNKAAYIAHATEAAKLFKKHGATRLVECWGDDVPEGKLTSFPMAVQCKDDETVVFSWITWPSRDARDSGMKNVMEEWQSSGDDNPMPFDGARMIFGGFRVVVDE